MFSARASESSKSSGLAFVKVFSVRHRPRLQGLAGAGAHYPLGQLVK